MVLKSAEIRYICVQLLRRDLELWYSTTEQVKINSIVRVPLRNESETGIVIAETGVPPHGIKQLKMIQGIELFPSDAHYFKFLERVSWYAQIDSHRFLARLHQFLQQKNEQIIDTIPDELLMQRPLAALTQEQQNMVSAVTPNIITGKHEIFVLHGVTGSGKTECYKKLFEETIAVGKSALFLFPEVSLARAFELRLARELPHLPISGFHSGTKKKEKEKLWRAIQDGKPYIIIGVHLPIMLPLKSLGLIVIDEEHEIGYQEKKHPKLNTKELALLRAQLYNVPILLGSATPSITTLYNVKHRGWKLFMLAHRFAGKFPEIKTVTLTTKEEKKKKRASFWISELLEQEIRARLARQEQTIIFMNRRGMHFFVQCSSCSTIFRCALCDVSLTLHENEQLVCHYCAYTCILPKHCSKCEAQGSHLLKKGIGTQQVVQILTKLFPEAHIARFDSDTQKKSGVSELILAKMHARQIDILVGTQSIAKGMHFPNVSLVGIIWADIGLHLPIFNSVETALQQLIQVAGRAGRSSHLKESLVVVQTIGTHQVLELISEEKYASLYAEEVESREKYQYPPFVRLSELELKHNNEDTLLEESQRIVTQLRENAQKMQKTVTVLGPAKPPVAKIEQVYRRKIYFKSNSLPQIIELYRTIKQQEFSSALFFTPSVLTL